MKNIPIIILNRDRLEPMKKSVYILRKKGYNNITVIDNGSTYKPLLEWYENNNTIQVYNNIVVPNNVFALMNLVKAKIEPFVTMTSDYYVFSDSDTVPIGEIPSNFIEHMIEYQKKYNVQKVALGIKIDDINDLNPNPNHPLIQKAIEIEIQYWRNPIDEDKCKLYKYPVDTTFSLYRPNAPAVWAQNSIRMGHPYLLQHAPFYYDLNNLPEDELYYLEHMDSKSANWSKQLKAYLNEK